ncbi:AcrR family transcriptional regulator [Saccharothrix ecbatanensis]|uniref:AcrR family transcriptional regulator n=1 Tax=Saccharothrix ecbatanensis TaxID=1105145 RepID=A0A7W9M0L2_9PSEU|nr:TetR/AcrR family transcriptional regulator [Saccharothrix ecbatanensis]MBB5802903.1 AcrR family transcriptional regulator [Saccharothrix ecbatanensis]
MTGGTTQLRVDAQHNRDRIVASARETFAAVGLDVSMTEIARRAGVGVATLYRRFPTKESLVTEVFADQLDSCAAVVHDALDDPDPWRGFCRVVAELCEMQARDRGFSAAFLSAFPNALPVDEKRAQAEEVLGRLVARAKESGRLRPDFAPEDLILVLMANNGLVTDSADATAAASRRLVAYFIQAFQADGPLPPPVRLDLREAIG